MTTKGQAVDQVHYRAFLSSGRDREPPPTPLLMPTLSSMVVDELMSPFINKACIAVSHFGGSMQLPRSPSAPIPSAEISEEFEAPQSSMLGDAG